MKRFEKFTIYQINELLKHLGSFQSTSNTEALHRIRVDIKKIKSIIGVIGFCNPSFKPHKQFIPFRNIFRRAGKIRDPEVLDQIRQQHQLADVPDLRNLNNQGLLRAFENDIPEFVKTIRKRKRTLEVNSSKVRRKDVEKYLAKMKREIKSQLTPKPKFRAIHKTRKSIKELIYLSEIIDRLRRKESSFYESMEHAIGRLHDRQALMHHLNRQGGKTDESYKLMRTEVQKEKESVRKLAKGFYK